MIVGIHHAALVVPDMSAAIAYYGAAYAFRPILEDLTDSASDPVLRALFSDIGDVQHAMLAGENGYLELFVPGQLSGPVREDRPVNQQGITHICLQSGDMDCLYPSALAAGAVAIAEPLDLGTGNLYCYARDPFGNVVELEALPHADPRWTPWIGHVSFSTPAIEPMAAFYSGLLESEVRNRITVTHNPRGDRLTGLDDVTVNGAWLMSGSHQIELWHYENPPTRSREKPIPMDHPGWQHIAVEVDDLAFEARRLKAAGATFIGGICANRYGASAFMRDPDGNVVELLELDAQAQHLSLRALPNWQRVAQVEALAA